MPAISSQSMRALYPFRDTRRRRMARFLQRSRFLFQPADIPPGGGANPTVRSSATYASAATETGGTVGLPSGWQAGDIHYIGWELTATNGTVTTPTGYTVVAGPVAAVGVVNAHHGVLRRVLQAGDADVAMTWTNGRFAAVSLAVQGADTTTPEDVTPTTDDNTGITTPNVQAPSITPVTANCLLLTWHAVRNGTNGASTGFTPDGTETEVNEASSAVAAISNAAIEAASLALGAAAATGTKTATATGTVTTINMMGSAVAVRPAAGGGGTNWTVGQTDSAGLTDTASVEQDKVLTDSAGLADAAVFTQSNVTTDSAGLTDSATEELLKLVDQTDSAGLTDSTSVSQAKVQTDSAGLTDATALAQSYISTDSAGLTDSATQELLKLVTATDSIGLTDAAALTWANVPTDSAGLTDTAPLEQQKVVTDSAGLTDTATQQLAKLVDQIDSAGLTDSTSVSQAKVQTDSAGLTDTIAASLAKIQTDSAGLTDTSSAGLFRDLIATDLAGLADAAAFAQFKTLTDSTGLTDDATVSGLVGPFTVGHLASTSAATSTLTAANNPLATLTATAARGGPA